MITPPIPTNEPARLAALRRYDVLDSLAEGDFDDLTRLAAMICGVPIALVSLVDTGRQWFKAKVGLQACETSRDISFCGHAILDTGIMEIPNALEDPRFFDNPLVTGEPKIRFYAGAPITTTDGYAIGTLCVIDRTVRQLNQAQREMLLQLATQVVRQLELRLHLRRLAEGTVPTRATKERPRLDRVGTSDVLWGVNLATGQMYTTRKWAGMSGHSINETTADYQQFRALIHPDERAEVTRAWDALCSGAAVDFQAEFRLPATPGDWRWVRRHGQVMQADAQGRPLVVAGNQSDIGGTKEIELAWRHAEERYRLLLDLAFEPIFILRDSRFLLANGPALRLLGAINVTDLAGRRTEEVVAPEFHDLLRARLGQLAAPASPPVLLTVEMLRLDGRRLAVELRAGHVWYQRQPAFQVVARELGPRSDERAAQSVAPG